MKKNRMMRLASGLLVAVLATTSVISGTYAKYTTQDRASDIARVAKWGVELQVVGSLYGEAYEKPTYDTEGNLTSGNIITDSATGISVKSKSEIDTTVKNVVAPGTKNESGIAFSLNGSPEVSSQTTVVINAQNIFLTAGKYGVMVATDEVTKVNFAALNTDADPLFVSEDGEEFKRAAGWAADAHYYTLEDAVEVTDIYYPVVYELAGADENGTSYTGDNGDDTVNEIAAAIAAKFGTAELSKDETGTITTYTVTSDVVTPNVELAAEFKLTDETITWSWDFGDVDKVGNSAEEDDMADTILGNLMAGTELKVVKLTEGVYKAPLENTDYCLKTQFGIDITVTQVD